MSFNFPNAPTEGTTYTPVGGYQYVYTGGVWRVVESPQARATAEARNRVCNPAMQISQENGNTTGAVSGYHAADQWFLGFVTSGALNCLRVQSPTPNGSKDRFRASVVTADTSINAGEVAYIATKIEGGRVADFRYGSATARQSILRFGWKSPAGTYSIAINNGASNRSYVANFVISAGQANIDTEQIFIIPGDVTGTWLTDTGIGMYIYLILATVLQGVTGWQAGQIFGTSANTNNINTVSNAFELFDVGLYLDPDATGLAPKWTLPDEAQELQACMRYWQKTFTMFSGNVTASNTYYGVGAIPVPSRPSPSITGTVSGQAGFPATVGTLVYALTSTLYESRVSNATGTGIFDSVITINARM